MGWCNTSPFWLKNIMCKTCRAPSLRRAMFFLGNNGACHSYSFFAPEGQMNVTKECIAFICPMLQMGGGEKNTHDVLVIVEHMWNPLCKNFLISPSCWWGYGKHLERFWLLWQLLCMKYYTYLQGQIHLFRVVFICRWCWGPTVRGITYLFLAILNSIHPSANSFIWKSMCPSIFLHGRVIL